MADAGRHRTVAGHTRLTGIRVQKITVHNAHPAFRVGQDMAGTYTIANGSGARQITFSVYGPSGTSQVACDSTPAFTTTRTVTANGTYKLPVYKPARSGFYAWSVTAAGDASSAPASTCASPIADRAVSKLGQYRPTSAHKISFGAPFGVGIVVSGFDRTESHVVTSRLYGPWPSATAARCTNGRAASGHAVTRTVVTNGRYAMPRVAVASALGAGYYVWRSTMAPGTLVTDSTSSCGIPFQVVK